MQLENIGFYTLSDQRAKTVSWSSDLQRCELILTDRCNFKCAYCRGVKPEYSGDMSFMDAFKVVDLWASHNLHNIRFSGGEPTLWKDFDSLVALTRSYSCFDHIAISTNGSASVEYYKKLHKLGVNDFSISLDACCAMTADMMAGVNAKFEHISNVIKELSKITYVTVGVVLDQRNDSELDKIIDYAASLGVSDIRIIPSAQSNHTIAVDRVTKFQILNYRINNIREGRKMRGVPAQGSTHKCHLVKDDMAIMSNRHFPCIIFLREKGNPIGTIDNKTMAEIREERKQWFNKHDTYMHPICRGNCLDVCVDYNNKVALYAADESTDA